MAEQWNLETVPTPCLVMQAERVQDNIQRMADYAQSHDIQLRPHTKTHKSKFLSQKQLDAGATGLTVAKTGEASVMKDVCNDILLAYPPVDPYRANRVAELAKETSLTVAVDSSLAIERLTESLSQTGSKAGILVELDLGFHRVGVSSWERSLELAKLVDQSPCLSLKGVMYYPGNISGPTQQNVELGSTQQNVELQKKLLADVNSLLEETHAQWKKAGLNCEVISGGSTPTMFQSHLVPMTTEVRPGTYIYNDLNTVHQNVATLEQCAALVYSTVISNAYDGQIVLDAGTKTLTSDKNSVFPDSGYGYILEYPKATITKLSEEHGQVDVSKCDKKPQLGERVTVLPNHICPCVNLQDSFWWYESGELIEMPVDARGLLI